VAIFLIVIFSVVSFCPLWPGFTFSMADVGEAARKKCHGCSVEKAIDQFYALRGPRRIVVNCLDCRDRKRREVRPWLR
jgi:hypothetical protein